MRSRALKEWMPLTVRLEVCRSSISEGFNGAKLIVAAPAQQAAHHTCSVIVIDREPAASFARAPAYRAYTALMFKQQVVLRLRNTHGCEGAFPIPETRPPPVLWVGVLGRVDWLHSIPARRAVLPRVPVPRHEGLGRLVRATAGTSANLGATVSHVDSTKSATPRGRYRGRRGLMIHCSMGSRFVA